MQRVTIIAQIMKDYKELLPEEGFCRLDQLNLLADWNSHIHIVNIYNYLLCAVIRNYASEKR